jgi:predicted dehydrogenase
VRFKMKKKLAIVGYGGQGAWHTGWAQRSDVISPSGVYDVSEKRMAAFKSGQTGSSIKVEI